MTIDFEFGPISPKDKKRVQALTHYDLEMANHPNPLAAADPNNDELVDIQENKLKDHPEQYWGGYNAAGDLDAYIKVDNWYFANAIQFANISERARLVAYKYKTRSHVIPRNPLCIMGLVADPSIAEYYGNQARTLVLGKLVDYAIAVSNEGDVSRDIFIPHYDGDVATEATVSRGFYFTGKSGTLFDIKQKLFVKPGYDTEPEVKAA